MEPTFFATPSDLRQWFEANHDTAKELLVGYYKKGSGKPSITWEESVDQALCFGWIDGIRRAVDEASYTIRFTPRKPNSVWSKKNIASVERLSQLGLMQPAGLKAFSQRKEEKSGIYSFEQGDLKPEEQQVLAKEVYGLLKATVEKTAKEYERLKVQTSDVSPGKPQCLPGGCAVQVQFKQAAAMIAFEQIGFGTPGEYLLGWSGPVMRTNIPRDQAFLVNYSFVHHRRSAAGKKESAP